MNSKNWKICHSEQKEDNKMARKIKLFYGGASIEALEKQVNDFCSREKVIDIKLAEGVETDREYTTIMVIYDDLSELYF